MDNKRIAQVVLAILVIIAALVGGWIAWDRYTERYAISREDDGTAITRIVSAKFSGASAIKVGALSGTVQASASDTRGFGMLTSDKVIKAPFSVDYFIDMSRVSADAYDWDPARRTLTIQAPDVVPAAPNIDWAAQTANRTRGLFVTRDAADQLVRRATLNAKTAAQKEGAKPEHLAVARENARRVLAEIATGPLAATGLGDVRVVVSFPFERRGPAEQMDRSRSLEEVLGNRR
ncbi:DUF4230 domain-containing protein [Sphingomonas alpina]|uniref:DUF4230 domain-containing protein n=1 Tax=Sphingomonas alpina TaxID=653931 RepID=A0A7H0LKY7_9SPHN|nr:DUF4230 domain-containing protein [Sphingomonas alpina]QNQ10340.1 DUF4230 domain-containing protein [Sphingomonas alpina]